MSAELYAAQLRAIADAVDVVAPNHARVTLHGGAVMDVPVANERGAYAGLAETLYGTRYNAPAEAPLPSGEDPAVFAAALRAANAVRQRFENGIAVPREMTTGEGGHYVVLGRAIREARSGRQVRFYWNLAAEGAATFVRELSARFERARIPFQAKVPVHPQGYARTDTGVLYLDDADVAASSDAIAAVYRAVGGAVRAEVPLFALPIVPGLAFAESPQNGDSFGMHRCALIAEGLVRAHTRGVSGEERLAVMREPLAEYGLDFARLAFNPHSRYPYRFAELGAGAAA
ncbi:MAG TPA: T3SS effector HopA1 family protein [Candidatus Elarobacter sp.]|nr:T3SS effector HopA1 family protein [Candidatus Elarobacter sp.]